MNIFKHSTVVPHGIFVTTLCNAWSSLVVFLQWSPVILYQDYASPFPSPIAPSNEFKKSLKPPVIGGRLLIKRQEEISSMRTVFIVLSDYLDEDTKT